MSVSDGLVDKSTQLSFVKQRHVYDLFDKIIPCGHSASSVVRATAFSYSLCERSTRKIKVQSLKFIYNHNK